MNMMGKQLGPSCFLFADTLDTVKCGLDKIGSNLNDIQIFGIRIAWNFVLAVQTSREARVKSIRHIKRSR